MLLSGSQQTFGSAGNGDAACKGKVEGNAANCFGRLGTGFLLSSSKPLKRSKKRSKKKKKKKKKTNIIFYNGSKDIETRKTCNRIAGGLRSNFEVGLAAAQYSRT